jgi:hypothetical protein
MASSYEDKLATLADIGAGGRVTRRRTVATPRPSGSFHGVGTQS